MKSFSIHSREWKRSQSRADKFGGRLYNKYDYSITAVNWPILCMALMMSTHIYPWSMEVH